MSPIKLFLVSPDPNFLKESCAPLWTDFAVQTVEPDLVTQVEIGGKILILDFDQTSLQIFRYLKEIKNSRGLGLISISQSVDLEVEEKAFKWGSDHIMQMPIIYKRLLWRIKTLCQWTAPTESSPLHIGDLTLYRQQFLVKEQDKPITLSPTLFQLLLEFAQNPNKLLSREFLQKNVWQGQKISPRSIDAQISKLKKILPSLSSNLLNIYGKGYILSLPKQKAA